MMQGMLEASDSAVNAIVVAAILAGPLLAVYWFGLRNARRFDEREAAADDRHDT